MLVQAHRSGRCWACTGGCPACLLAPTQRPQPTCTPKSTAEAKLQKSPQLAGAPESSSSEMPTSAATTAAQVVRLSRVVPNRPAMSGGTTTVNPDRKAPRDASAVSMPMLCVR